MHVTIPLSVPNLCGNELAYVERAIRAEWVSTGGGDIDDFETTVAQYVHVAYAVACQSGTAALHLALLAGGIGPGQAVLVPTLTFVAAVNPVRYVGAQPIFIDCDDTLCMDVGKLARFCEQECRLEGNRLIHKSTGSHVSAVIVVHVFGNLADMDGLMDLADKYNLFVVEDATEALGSRWAAGRYAGRHAGTVGHVGAYSFNGNKIITTGGGGMVVSNNGSVADTARYLSQQAKDDPFYFVHNEVGFNYRMTNVQAAIGLAQMEQLDAFIETKTRNYRRYRERGLSLLGFREDILPNYWFYSYLTTRRDALISYLSEEHSIRSRPVWHPIHSLPPYKDEPHGPIDRAPWYVERIVNLPCSTNLSTADVDRVADAVLSFSGMEAPCDA